MQAVREAPVGCDILTARDLLPCDLFHELRTIFDTRRVEYVAHVLTAGELRVLGSLRDALIIARIKRMPLYRLQRFDRFICHDEQAQRFYRAIQTRWLRDEEYLLGTRLGRSPTWRELFVDFMKHRNGLRFRAYFTMKFPQKMKLVGPAIPPGPTSGRAA